MVTFRPENARWMSRFLAVLLAAIAVFAMSFAMPQLAIAGVSPKLEKQILEVIRKHPEVILKSVQAYQQEQQQAVQQRRFAFLQTFNRDPQTIIANSPTTGATEPQVFLVEFSDFQCPFCAQAHDTVAEFMENHGDTVQLVYKHFPLISIHPEANNAAQAAFAANEQGKFWNYHDRLFQQQDELGESFYVQLAEELELDIEEFNRDRQFADESLAGDRELAEQLAINGTPFFIIFAPGTPQGTGESFSGAVTLEELEAIFARTTQTDS
ncbi:DsbA family protein [Roseofilum casamattae]|uniref:Thioredoxin domain-containing protein n=1 Tax=Roseofilum casamattae BLCC-M143 TaxID=3022442 RepID=A0ABT7BY72_9CYAN|nr:thioredoxin domain-containing protein [Roseofilum casamattae]MDJ1184140.1 thioredoxin domain-containing protein [Roseofilum casamattae BLCC-M143]